ncbi:MAG: CDP-diacylglycerol--serine O-phosphatidyltransferase [Bacteroidales bacterium]|nr:CDP-diacylglycerol--serine O-phosphatidyltransferase [Bacteroidales bacterium]
MKKQIPNFFTLLNLLCGCIAIVAAFHHNLIISAYLIGIAAFFDFIDGVAARLLKVTSEIGKQLDSLADIVSFGVVPGIIIFVLIDNNNTPIIEIGNLNIIPYIAFIIPIFSALRLAKFNIDTRQTVSFIGLPTPANAILIGSFPLILNQESSFVTLNLDFISFVFSNPYFLIIITILLSYLLIAEIRLFSLKFQNFKWSDNPIRYIFLGISLILICIFYYVAIPIIISLYIILSIIKTRFKQTF